MEGVAVREVAGPASGSAANQSVVHAVIDAGAQTVEHVHHTTEEVVWVLEGSGSVRIDGEHRDLAAGGCVVISPGARHKTFNTGEGPLVLLACCCPPYSADDTVVTE